MLAEIVDFKSLALDLQSFMVSLDSNPFSFISVLKFNIEQVIATKQWRTSYFIHTCYFAHALVVHESKSCFLTAAVAVTELTHRVARERRGRTLATATSVTTCTFVVVITCHAFAI